MERHGIVDEVVQHSLGEGHEAAGVADRALPYWSLSGDGLQRLGGNACEVGVGTLAIVCNVFTKNDGGKWAGTVSGRGGWGAGKSGIGLQGCMDASREDRLSIYILCASSRKCVFACIGDLSTNAHIAKPDLVAYHAYFTPPNKW